MGPGSAAAAHRRPLARSPPSPRTAGRVSCPPTPRRPQDNRERGPRGLTPARAPSARAGGKLGGCCRPGGRPGCSPQQPRAALRPGTPLRAAAGGAHGAGAPPPPPPATEAAGGPAHSHGQRPGAARAAAECPPGGQAPRPVAGRQTRPCTSSGTYGGQTHGSECVPRSLAAWPPLPAGLPGATWKRGARGHPAGRAGLPAMPSGPGPAPLQTPRTDKPSGAPWAALEGCGPGHCTEMAIYIKIGHIMKK